MLTVRTVFAADGVSLADVACRHGRGRGEVEPAPARMLVLVRRGCFARSANGVVSVLDPTVACFINPGEEQRYDHPHDNGDDCTTIDLDATLASAVHGGQPDLPVGAIPISPTLDLAHRILLAQARHGDDRHQLYERALRLIAAVLQSASPARVVSGGPDSERARYELARELTVSPHHLSRVFSAVTGHTISRHRMRLRTRAALERLAAGENNLARLAADLGFTDQSHLCRVVRSESDIPPSVVRRLLT